MPKLTKQQADPHSKLVECRKALESVLGLTRNHAAAICNRLTDSQVQAILESGNDKTRVQKAVEGVDQPPEPPKPEIRNVKKK